MVSLTFVQRIFSTSLSNVIPLFVVEVHNDPNLLNNKFYVEQNYPNSFYPTTTTIEYAIPSVVKENFPSLQLGKEVATIVNETKKSGNYKDKFDETDISTGIYYYQLVIGNFVQTNKMILLK